MKESIELKQFLRLSQKLKQQDLQGMVANQKLLKLATGEEYASGEYICATSFVEEQSYFGQYLSNITYLGFDKANFYFKDKDNFLIRCNYAVTCINDTPTIVLTSANVLPTEFLEKVLQLSLDTSTDQLTEIYEVEEACAYQS